MNKFFFNEIVNKIKHKKNIPKWLATYLSVKQQIKNIRNTLGMTQSQLAKKIESSQEAIARLESGEKEPNISTLKKVAEALESELMVLIIPKKSIKDIILDKATIKAKEILDFTKKSSSLEKQMPSEKIVKQQLKETIKEIIDKRKSSLWD